MRHRILARGLGFDVGGLQMPKRERSRGKVDELRGSIVAITWDDASYKGGIVRAVDLPLRYRITTVGHVAHEDDETISLVGEVLELDSADGSIDEYRQVTTIPKSLIRETKRYREDT